MTTPDSELETIEAMARADHAYRLPRSYNPYPVGSDKAAAWDQGWDAEDETVHGLDEEIVKLPQFRIRTEIVSGDAENATVLATIEREAFTRYRVCQLRPAGPRAVTYESDEARAQFPEAANVRIRVTYEGEGGMFD